MNNILLLHTVDDAEHCVQEKLYNQFLLFSTHSSVDVYLQRKYDIKCQCISTLLTVDQVLHARQDASDAVDTILDILDRHISPLLKEQMGLDMQWFRPLYSYYGKYHYCAYLLFHSAIQVISNNFQPKEIGVYPYTFSALIHSGRTIQDVLQVIAPSTKIVTYTSSKPTVQSRNNLRQLIKRLTSPRKVLAYTRALLNRRLQHRYSAPSRNPLLLVTEPIGEISFLLRENVQEYSFLYYAAGRHIPAGYNEQPGKPTLRVDLHEAEEDAQQTIGTTIAKLFVEDICYSFASALPRYAYALDILQSIHARQPIVAGVWGGPPVEGIFSLLYEYLRSVGVPVVGYQHGSVYGDSWEPWHFDSDFSRCDYFISYGWTKDDLQRLYPNRQTTPEIMPFGKVKLPSTTGTKKKIDILFPLTSSVSIFEGGMIRIPPHELTERQVRLLEYLDTLDDCSVYIKLFPYSTYANCSVLPILQRLKNINVVDTMSFVDFLETHHPAAVLIEYPSTPLLEVLHLDTEVFLMNDVLHPFEEQALNELCRRVHYTITTEAMLILLEQFRRGTLKQKRDDTFLQHYVRRHHTQDHFRQLLHTLVNSRTSPSTSSYMGQ